ncbi:MAG: PSD1 and planctomycete cytochrome C domain-containing protein [Planctomycetota bacterium]
MLTQLLLTLCTIATPLRDDTEHFEAKIRPALIEHCGSCHGERRQRSGLRLDGPSGLRTGGDRGPALVPGDPEASLLIRAIRYDDEELQMPPSGRLDAATIALLEDWVRSGAAMPGTSIEPGDLPQPTQDFTQSDHWAFQPLRSPSLPPIERSDWPRDPIDDFILARLEEQGLAPTDDADARTWLRRVTFDLTGLPPSPGELAAFLSDDPSARAERAVDRLLAAPQFGEQWGRHWLDVVAYAESRGHEFDYTIANAFQYRDYVVRAFNADVPYDDFVVEHLAGDLLERPRVHPEDGFDESVLGTGMWQLGEAVHSPVDIRGDQTERLAARVDVFGKAFLGLTVACARCHDHKFDPISARDYYALCGYLLSSRPRQVRFDSERHNLELANELESLGEANEARLRRWLSRELRPEVDRLETWLEAASTVLETEPLARAKDIVFEDFEADGFTRWTSDGEAFGQAPLKRAQLASYQGDVGAIGDGLVNSHNVVNAEGVAHSDHFRGRLTSQPFVIERKYVHFLIGGGNHVGQTAVQLLVDGQVVRETPGPAANRMRPHSFDVGELAGREARLVLVDEWSEGWGNLGVDHIVFSDRSAVAVFGGDDPSARLEERRAVIDAIAKEGALDREVLTRWTAAMIEAERDEWHLLRPWLFGRHGDRDGWRRTARAWQQRALEALGALDTSLVRADGARPEDWILDGPTLSWVRPGTLRIGEVSSPIVGIRTRGGVEADPIWSVLEIDPVSESDPTQINWRQDGRTVQTKTFRLEHGRLFYRVRGSGKSVAIIDGYRTVNGPLHHEILLSWSGAADQEQWIEQDLRDYVGERVWLEISPIEKDSRLVPFGVSAIVESDDRPFETSAPGALLFEQLDPRRLPEPQELTEAYRTVLSGALDRLVTGRLSLAARSAEESRWLDWIIGIQEVPPASAPELAGFFEARSELIEGIRRRSRLAPALLDGSGVDELFLPRGSHRSAQEPVPRRLLTILGGARSAPPRNGSGRLELARRLVDPESNPLVARVIVNRAWHHLFGRGLVASVDNFGLLGEAPTHPELLDHLATRLVSEGWSLKRLIRAIVLSRTYGLSSVASGEARSQDPTNRLWQHAMVRRLSGEQIRDAVLAISGSLDRTMGGPSVPVHLTPFMEGRGRPGSGPLDGNGRRSLYLSVRRNFLSPFFLAFDFPVPMTTVGRRSVSNVPAQALAMLNDPFVLAATQEWSRRVLAEHDRDEDRLAAMFLTALCREPSPEEATRLLEFVSERSRAAIDPVEIWTDVGHVLLNTKELLFLR